MHNAQPGISQLGCLLKIKTTPQLHAQHAKILNVALSCTRTSIHEVIIFDSPNVPQPSHTHQNRNTTAAKKPNQAFHPTPVFWAILSILFIVPFSLFLELSNWSFIFSARVVESRISSPIRCVNYLYVSEPSSCQRKEPLSR